MFNGDLGGLSVPLEGAANHHRHLSSIDYLTACNGRSKNKNKKKPWKTGARGLSVPLEGATK